MCMAFYGFAFHRQADLHVVKLAALGWLVRSILCNVCASCACSAQLAERFPNPFEAELEELKDRYAQMQVGYWKLEAKKFQFLKHIQIHMGDLAELKVLRGWNPKAECRECPIAREAAGLTVCLKLQSCTMLFQCAYSLAALAYIISYSLSCAQQISGPGGSVWWREAAASLAD